MQIEEIHLGLYLGVQNACLPPNDSAAGTTEVPFFVQIIRCKFDKIGQNACLPPNYMVGSPEDHVF